MPFRFDFMAGLLKKGRCANEVYKFWMERKENVLPRSAAMIPVLAGQLMGTKIRKKIVTRYQ